MNDLQAAAVAQLEAVWVASRVHEIGAVPNSPATPYAVVSVSQGQPANYRHGSRSVSKTHRISVQLVGANYAEAAFAAQKADAAFLDQRLTVADTTCTPCRRDVEATIQRDPDGSVLMYGFASYTFTTTPA